MSKKRNPIVALMGHVNHGKTSLLDALCESNIVTQEFGDITQNITAYNVVSKYGNFTIVDTPGHAAFINMRKRGISCTDIIILVVAADDGVMPQTKEIIQFAKKENTPIIVAINKIDIQNEKIKEITTNLAKLNVVSEEWGGDVLFVKTSAKTKIGINNLIEAVQLQATLINLEIKENENLNGVILESHIWKGFGNTVALMLFTGNIKKKDVITIGSTEHKIKTLLNANKEEINKVSSGVPFYIARLDQLPIAGATVTKQSSVKKIQKIKKKGSYLLTTNNTDVTTTKKQFEIRLIVKSNTYGGAEATAEYLKQLATEKTHVHILTVGTGVFYENDVKNAILTNSLLVGLSTGFERGIKKFAETSGICVYTSNIIYDLLHKIKKIIEDKENEKIIQKKKGSAKVKTLFNITKTQTVFGCIITLGTINIGDIVEIQRNGEKLVEATIETLQHYKKKVTSVKKGIECGIGLNKKIDLKENDVFITYEEK